MNTCPDLEQNNFKINMNFAKLALKETAFYDNILSIIIERMTSFENGT